MVRTPSLSRIHNKRSIQAQTLTDQEVMNRTNRNERRNVAHFIRELSAVAIRVNPIAQDQNFFATTYQFSSLLTQCSQGDRQTIRTGRNVVQGRKARGWN